MLSPVLPADSAYADLEVVADSWSKHSFLGIRALPEVLEHGFRQQSLCETVSRGTIAVTDVGYYRSCRSWLHSHTRFDSFVQLSAQSKHCVASQLNVI